MNRQSVLCCTVAAGLLISAAAHASTITWGSPTTVAADSDVITTGTLVYARNFSQTQVPVTVNGVLFDIFPIPNGSTGAAGIPLVANLGYINSESSDTSYGSTAAPFSGLSTAYRTLLGSGAGSSTGNTLTLTLLNLTNNATYLFQFWANDSDLVHGGDLTIASAGSASVLVPNTAALPGGLGQWVSGTFTASGTTQVITFDGLRPMINAFQLREVPAPGAAALLGLGALAAVRRRRV